MKSVVFVMVLGVMALPSYGSVEDELFSHKETRGCKAVFLKKNESKCDSKKTKKIHIAPIVIPDKRDKKIAEIDAKLAHLIEEFSTYKKEKEQEIRKINRLLRKKSKTIKRINAALLKNQKKMRALQASIKSQKIKKKKRVKKQKIVKKSLSTPQKSLPPQEVKPLPSVQNLPWVEVVVEDGLSIYQLALKYYKDREEYKRIYVANRSVIGRDFKIEDGMLLKIPITEKFKDQPMFLNLN